MVGDYHGENYVTFPNLAFAGQSYEQTFTVHNPTGTAVDLDLSDGALTTVHEQTLSVSWPGFAGSTAVQPHYLLDVSSLIATHAPDMLRAQIVFPYDVFDTTADYSDEDGLNVFFYDWKDLNADGNLWTDDNANGWVDDGEIDKMLDPGTGLDAFEYNRMNSGYHFGGISGTALETSLSKDSIARQHDGIFLGVQRSKGSEALTFDIRLTFYQRSDWNWLDVPTSVTVPAGGDASFVATMNVPVDAAPGVYQGGILYGNAEQTILPVMVNVASDSPAFGFGAETLSEPRTGVPYENGQLYGAFNWDDGFEAGDWRFYSYDVPVGMGGPGKSLIVDVEWTDPQMDVDVYVLGAASDALGAFDPDLFGPQSMSIVEYGLVDSMSYGKHRFATSSGGPRQILTAPYSEGLGTIALRSVLFGGQDFSEPIVGNAFVVDTAPYNIDLLSLAQITKPWSDRRHGKGQNDQLENGTSQASLGLIQGGLESKEYCRCPGGHQGGGQPMGQARQGRRRSRPLGAAQTGSPAAIESGRPRPTSRATGTRRRKLRISRRTVDLFSSGPSHPARV